jgi:predicted sugar kinase
VQQRSVPRRMIPDDMISPYGMVLQVRHRIPEHNGFGSEEDTLLNVARLIPIR